MDQPITLHGGKLGRSVATALAILLAWAALISLPLKAQENPPQEVSTRNVEPTFKVQAERNLVTVRAVVRNKKGETVDNLRQEDFQVFDRGKKQTILQFNVDKAGLNVGEQNSSKLSPQEPGAAGKTPAFTLPRRFMALYFDDVSTGFSGLVRAREAAMRFLQTSFHPGDRVGVFTSSAQKTLDFTDDLDAVGRALINLAPRPIISKDETCGAITPYEAYLIVTFAQLSQQSPPQTAKKSSTSGNSLLEMARGAKQACSHLAQPPSPEEVLMDARRVQSETEMSSRTVLRGIELLVPLMASLPGQRSIVIVSDGFLTQTLGDEISRISEHALRSQVIINALDARGLYVGEADAETNAYSRSSATPMLNREEALRQSEAMGTLAQDTGGIFVENTNDLQAGFERSVGLPGAAYVLAFSPENLKHDGAYHTLKVTLASAQGFTVQARKGYFAPRKEDDLAAQEKDDLQDAVFSQNEMQAIPTEINIQFVMVDKTEAEIDVLTHVDVNHVHFRKTADRNIDDLTFVTAIFDRDGRFISGQQKVLELRLRDASVQKFLRTGIKVDTVLKAKPGTYLVRTVVRDSESGQISAVNSAVEIPY